MSFIYEPFAFLLRIFYSFTKNYAIALIFFTLIVKLVFSFINVMQQRSAQGQARIKPKINAIRKRYEGRKDSHVQIEFQNDMQRLYQEEKVSASMGCLPILIQLLIVMVLYQIIYNPLTYIAQFEAADFTAIKQIIVDNFASMSFSGKGVKESIEKVLTNAEVLDKVKGLNISEMELISIINQNKALFGDYVSKIPNFTAFGGSIDLSAKPTLALKPIVLIPILTVVFQLGSFYITRLVGPKPDTSTPEAKQAAKSMNTTNLIMTLVSGYIAFSFPAIIGIYWIYQSIIGTVITVVLHKVMPIPTYTEEEMLAIEAEYNKDYVRPEISDSGFISSIHDEDYEGYEELDGEYEEYEGYEERDYPDEDDVADGASDDNTDDTDTDNEDNDEN